MTVWSLLSLAVTVSVQLSMPRKKVVTTFYCGNTWSPTNGGWISIGALCCIYDIIKLLCFQLSFNNCLYLYTKNMLPIYTKDIPDTLWLLKVLVFPWLYDVFIYIVINDWLRISSPSRGFSWGLFKWSVLSGFF